MNKPIDNDAVLSHGEIRLANGFSLVIVPDSDNEHEDATPVFVAESISFLNRMKLKPALVCDCSDHLRSSWVFDRPLSISQMRDRKRIHITNERFKKIIRSHAESHGIVILGKDFYFDHPYNEGEVILSNSQARYSLEDFERYFVENAIKTLSGCKISWLEGRDPWNETISE